MQVNIVEVSHPDKRHPSDSDKRNHILLGYIRTYCGLKEFDGCGQMVEAGSIKNLCARCKKLAGVPVTH